MMIGIDSVLLLLHIIFFCYWLGADLGVFYSARFAVAPDIGQEARRYCARIMYFVDQFPRVSMIGTVMTGATVGILRGYFYVDDIWIWPIWIIGLLWIGEVIFLYINDGKPEKTKSVKKFDFYFRILFVIAVVYIAISSILGFGITSDHWLSAKLLALAAAQLCGVGLRAVMRNFGQPFAALMAGTATPDQAAYVQTTMAKGKIFVIGIWIFITVAAAFGLWKPI